MNTLEKPKIRL